MHEYITFGFLVCLMSRNILYPQTQFLVMDSVRSGPKFRKDRMEDILSFGPDWGRRGPDKEGRKDRIK